MWARVAVAVLALCGCASDPQEPRAVGKMVAIVSTAPARSKLIVVDATAQDRVLELIDGSAPVDFRWLVFEVDTSRMEQVRSAAGLDADMRDGSSGLSFSQVYPGPCNPALDRFDKCLLVERLDAGKSGVSGDIHLQLGDSLEGSYDVSIEGPTDRFGDPVQWHRHGSNGDVSVELGGVP